MIRSLLVIGCLLVGASCLESYKGRYQTSEGDVVQYYIESTASHAQLLLNLAGSPDPVVNVTYDRRDGGIRFHILGHDHFQSTEADFEEEALVTRELMETSVGRCIPELSFHVFEEHGVYGYQDEGMMLLYQIAMFSDTYHEGSPLMKWRSKRSLRATDQEELEERASNEEIMASIEGVLPEDMVAICEGDLLKDHRYCSSDLGVVGSENQCKIKDHYDTEEVHQFTLEEVGAGCYGLCGPWCHCWSSICGDCCWHPGCYQHDVYCDKPNSLSCKLGKGVVYGTKGLHKC